MQHTGVLIRLALAVAVLSGGWVAWAQVTTKEKPSSRKPAPKAAVEKIKEKVKPNNQTEDDEKPAATAKKPKAATEEKPAADQASPEVAEILAGAEKFEKAYNAHDAQAVAALFAKKAEFTDEDGNLIQGREAIEADFAKMFEAFPDCKIAIEVDSVRVMTPHIALEEGVVRGQPKPDGDENLSSYLAIHVKVEDEWLIGSVSDSALEQEPTPHDYLQELAWMVGDWMDESPDAVIKSSCQWDASGNYLLHEFVVQVAGNVSVNGSMRIGWDPLTRQFKSWMFDADGGYAEGLWTRMGDEWLVSVRGVNAAGEATTAIGVFRFIDDETMTWRSHHRTVGGQPAAEIPENLIKRQPPKPAS